MAGTTGPLDCAESTKQVVRVTSWSQRRRGRFWVEIVLAVVVGVAAFVAAAVVSTAARSHVPAVLLGLFFLLVVLAVARFAGILYALPVGVVTIEAFDWYFLPPLRILDGATVFVLALFLAVSIIVGGFATRPAAARPGQNRLGVYWPRSRRPCGGWRRWSPASPRPPRSSRR